MHSSGRTSCEVTGVIDDATARALPRSAPPLRPDRQARCRSLSTSRAVQALRLPRSDGSQVAGSNGNKVTTRQAVRSQGRAPITPRGTGKRR